MTELVALSCGPVIQEQISCRKEFEEARWSSSMPTRSMIHFSGSIPWTKYAGVCYYAAAYGRKIMDPLIYTNWRG